MRTNIILIDSNIKGRAEAMREAEKFAAYNGLTGKHAMHIRLLTEETISMVHGIVNGFAGAFWLEAVEDFKGLLCRICVSANVSVDEGQEDKLLEIATSGKNEEAKGIMGKVREIFRLILQQSTAEAEAQSNTFNSCHNMGTEYDPALYNAEAYWSLQQYINDMKQQEPEDAPSWDELEKSIVVKLADEVKVGLSSQKAQVTIEKFFPNSVLKK